MDNENKKFGAAGAAFLACGITFMGVALATRQFAFMGIGPAFLALGVVFLAKSKKGGSR